MHSTKWKDASLFEGMRPRGGLGRYQAEIVKQVRAEGAHIAMPECAGGPVVGVELIRRLRRHAVVFAPTVAAQLGWQDELARCTDLATLTGLPTLDPRVPAPITLLSYYDLQTAEAATALLSDLAVDAWVAELVATGQARDEAAARARVERGRAHNPRKFDRTLARRHAQITATLLHGPPADLVHHLSPMTRHLIEALVAGPVRMIVLDACDQLRGGWAVALRYLAHRIATENGPPTVIGLSTVPHGVPGAHRYCRRVVGGHDVSPPAPALVHEGAIAPYRDLVHFVPTGSEKARTAAEILAREQAARPCRLRAVALAEREVDGQEVLRALLADQRARGLDPVLVTRDGLMVNSDGADGLLTSCARILRRLEIHASCRIAQSTVADTRLLVGEGPDWSARTVATLGAWALDSGMTRCLVSTVGEALDTGEFDTLVDLSTRPTVTTAKLRDRALRPDESVPGKVAHIWHVVATCDRAHVQRFAGQDRWGLALTEPRGRAVRGPAALDYMLASGAFGAVDYRWLTIRCLAEIGDRDASRRQWAQGARQSIRTVASVDAARVAQPRGLRELSGWLALPLLLAALLGLLLRADSTALERQVAGWLWLGAQGAELTIAALTGVSALWAWQVFNTGRGSVESRLLVLGHAVLDALRDGGHLDPHLRTSAVRLRHVGQRYEITVEGGSRRDAEVFATALAETLSPPRGQPHVVAAGSHCIPVPKALSREPKLFLRAWRRRGGVGRLADGPPASARQGAVAFEVWDTDWASTPPRRERRAGAQPPVGQPRLLDQPARTPAHEPLVPVDRGELLGRHAQA